MCGVTASVLSLSSTSSVKENLQMEKNPYLLVQKSHLNAAAWVPLLPWLPPWHHSFHKAVCSFPKDTKSSLCPHSPQPRHPSRPSKPPSLSKLPITHALLSAARRPRLPASPASHYSPRPVSLHPRLSHSASVCLPSVGT